MVLDIGFTSGYSIGLATALNPKNPSKPMRAAAELWHYLCYKYNDQQTNPKVIARGGFFYIKHEWWERITGYSRKTYCDACDLLAKAGLIEYKKMYILGTHTSVNHFRLLYGDWKLAPDCAFFVKPDLNPLHIPDCEVTSQPYNTKDNTQEEDKVVNPLGSHNPTHQPSAESSKDELDSVQFPFDDPVKEVVPTSIRPDKDKNAAARRRQEFAILGDIRKHFGFEKGGDSRLERQLVHDRLSDGWSKAEIIKVVAWLKENKEWYKDKTLRHCLGKEAFDEYQAANGTGNSNDFFAGMTDDQIHYWKMNHDPEYAEEFERKVREAGNL